MLSPAVHDRGGASAAHFRAYERKAVRLGVGLAGPRSGEQPATIVDISLAGAGLETDEALVPGERVSLTITTPTLWDPLVVSAIVAWSQPPKPREPGAPIGRRAAAARSGLAFEYPSPDVVLAVFEMLATLGYE